MFRKRSVIISMLVIVSILFTACGEKPEAMVEDYIKAMKRFDLDEMGEYVLSEGDGQSDGQDLEDEIEDMEQDTLVKYFKDNADKIEYEILGSDIKDDEGTVKVKFKYVDGTPVLGNVMREYMSEVMVLAFSDTDLDDERADEILNSIFNEEIEKGDVRFVEREIDIPVKKKDDKWYISDVSDKLLDVAMCNSVSIFSEFEDGDFEDEEIPEGKIVTKDLGETFELATIEVTTNSIEEKEKLKGFFDEEIYPKEGAKFMVLDLDIMNITKEKLSVGLDGFILVDNREREFDPYDSFDIDENTLNYRELAPSIKENGVYIYEVPEDAEGFSLFMGHADTNDTYIIDLGK